ncbi:hypothetical protein GW781_14010, partial [bacterium]|nr:hypothetical protein [bacterium]
LYFASVGAAQLRNVTKLFGWTKEIADRTVNKLVEKELLAKASHPKHEGEWLTVKNLSK